MNITNAPNAPHPAFQWGPLAQLSGSYLAMADLAIKADRMEYAEALIKKSEAIVNQIISELKPKSPILP